ncbi:MAG: TolC family protein [Acidobacteriota bacterium]
MPQAVERAVKNYPAVRASIEQAAAAAAGVDVARTAYLPRADFAAQINRATRNNIFGLMLPQAVIPSISGPVLGTNDLTSVWGSAAGVLVSWEPFDFGLRHANIGVAESAKRRADAARAVTEFQVGAAAADAFLTALAAGEKVSASRAGVERARVLNEVVAAQAGAGLRPGADAARTRAEVAAAQTQLIEAEQTAAVARAALAQLLGSDAADAALAAGPLLSAPPERSEPPPALDQHPAAREQGAAVEESQAREHALARSYFPKFNLQAASYARGTGARMDGSTAGGLTGLGPNVQNWAVGMTVYFPAFEFASLRARGRAEAHRERAETEQYNRVVQDLEGGLAKARAQLEGARRAAANTPIELEAARAAERQASARYKAGLGLVIEVAEAQRLLTQAEIDDALARLAVWRGLLAVAAAEGNLAPFLAMASK